MKNKNQIPAKTLKVLVLGGGPIGLYLGYQLIKMAHQITIFEKRKKYTRNNIISLQETVDLDTLSIIPSEIIEELNQSSSFAVAHQILQNDKEESKTMLQNKPYLTAPSRFYYLVLNELESAYQKHYLLQGGQLIKPKINDQFTDIQLKNNVLSFKDNGMQSVIRLDAYDLIFINDGARSFYRHLFFNLTSYVQSTTPNIIHCGLDNSGKLTIDHNLNHLQPFCYGCVLLYKIENTDQFRKQFNSIDKLKEKNISNDICWLETNTFQCKMNKKSINKKQKIMDSQNMFRMFVCDAYVYISIMINNIDCYRLNLQQTNYSQLPFNIQIYLLFALYYYDLSELIDLTSKQITIKLFPLTYTFVKQCSSFTKRTKTVMKEDSSIHISTATKKHNDNYQFVTLCGDAMVSGNFHAGIVLNRNLVAVHQMCQQIDQYIDSYPKINNQLSVHFLRLMFFQSNLMNEKTKNDIIKTSIHHTIHFKKLSTDTTRLYFSDVHLQMKHLFVCKNCTGNVTCNNVQQFIKFIHDYLHHPTLRSILKYLRHPQLFHLTD